MRDWINVVLKTYDESIILPEDANDVRLGKQVFVRLSLVAPPMTFIGFLLAILSGSKTMIGFAVIGSLIVTLNILGLRKTKNFNLHFSIWLAVLVIVSLSWGIIFGGYTLNHAVYWLSLLIMLQVILVSGQRTVLYWGLVMAALLSLFTFLDPFVQDLSKVPAFQSLNNLVTILLVAAQVILMLVYYKREKNNALRLLAVERERSENLLLNILPLEIAERLKDDASVIADQYGNASIMFADLVNFTPLTSQMTPSEMIELLNTIYSYFDTLAEKYGVEKIRTIGDSYMVASGVPTQRPDHAPALANMALDMQAFAETLPEFHGLRIQFRIGINSGPLVAGVIGHKKFHYDVWGDSVNTASRMESHGVPGRIQVSADTYHLLKDSFPFEKRGEIEVKGKGKMETWLLMRV